ncbi:hypothetical protein [Limibacillus halophilus]|uniref:Uncharacterized protein n=1 Tax=Limibacillus halophilus TaxID=1579333 RepID=A0A839SYQ4_9PROT|nr:hypothetical protein [Limibacillus halophilus]MBB3066063.1 hypothetical protein [Limibacillus halophilus]
MTRQDTIRPLLLATAMTLGAEAVYLVVWGLLLFPEGSIAAKFAWAAICGLGMGMTIGGLTLVMVSGRLEGGRAFIWSVAIFSLVGVICTLLCATLDAKLALFGGPKWQGLFLVSGILPAIFAGFFYAWSLWRPAGRLFLLRFGL